MIMMNIYIYLYELEASIILGGMTHIIILV